MKILSWNIYKDNQRLDEALEFLKTHEADVICLQELPVSGLDKVKDLGRHVVYEREEMVYKNGLKKPDVMYSVIISRLEMKGHGIISHRHSYEDVSKVDDRYEEFKSDSIYMDVVDSKNRAFRIFNVHFKCVAGPFYRLAQFKEVLAHFDRKRVNIICGDLNAFGHPIINLFVWQYFGYRIREFFVYEKRALGETFDKHRLTNPFRNHATFLKFPLQLDYIVVPQTVQVKAKKRYYRTLGSDHLPIGLEI